VLEEVHLKIAQMNKQIEDLESDSVELDLMLANKPDFTPILIEENKNINILKNELNSLLFSSSNLKNKLFVNSEKKIFEAKLKVSSIENEINLMLSREKARDEKISLLNKKKEELSGVTSDFKEKEKSIKIEKQIQETLSQFLIEINNQSISYLSEITSKLLKSVKNSETISCDFIVSEKVRAGKTVSFLDLGVFLNSIQVDIKDLSGGQQTALELCLDLALIKLIESRSKFMQPFLFLDEPFNGLDNESVLCLVSLIKEFNMQSFIVDHSSAVKEVDFQIIEMV
jgi:DNA repair exonuclease SbcCD ATPase subunit